MKRALKIILGVLFLGMLGYTFVFLWSKTRPEKVEYEIISPKIDTLERRVVATGKVEPRDEVLIKPQIFGIISEVYRQAGEMIRQGEVIAKVKVIPEMASLNSAQSTVTLSVINAEHTQANFYRVKSIYYSGEVSIEENETIEAALARAREAVQT